jgi:threonine/homoserine/homoserine lactone efflux protein
MPDPSTLVVFALAALALLIVPGPAVLFIVTRSVEGGRRAGLASAAGVHIGSLVHVAAATLGLSALIVRSATAFTAVKYAGAAYLVFLGVRRLLDHRSVASSAAGNGTLRRRPTRRLLAEGAVVNVLNPKTALFFLAFLPQFADPSNGHVALQLAALGLVFIALGLVSDGTYALLAGTVGERLHGRPRFLRAERWISASVYLGLGAATALAGGRHRTNA